MVRAGKHRPGRPLRQGEAASIPLLFGLALLAVGCRSAHVGALLRQGQAGEIPSARGKPREDMLAAAIEGLTWTSGVIEVAGPHRRDRAKALRAARNAEKTLRAENIRVKAAGYFRDAILADPSYAPAYEGIARCLLVEGEPALVEAALRTALNLDARFDEARYEMGVIAQVRGDYPRAIAAWTDLVAGNPGFADAYARLAIASYYEGDLPAARRFLGEADRRKQRVPPQFRDLLQQAEPLP